MPTNRISVNLKRKKMPVNALTMPIALHFWFKIKIFLRRIIQQKKARTKNVQAI